MAIALFVGAGAALTMSVDGARPALGGAVVALLATLAVALGLIVAATRRPAWLPQPWGVALDRVRHLASEGPWSLATSVALHLAGKAWIVVEFALLAALLGWRGWSAAVALAVASTVGSAVGVALPGQVGAVEAALAGAGALAGFDAATVMAMAVLRRTRGLFWTGAGLLLAARCGRAT
jgi:hypothetical protein